jgi:tyrosinase
MLAMAGSMVYRLEADDAAAPHLAAFRAAMAAAQDRLDNESYNWIAGFHGAPGWYCWHHQFSQKTPLQARLFLPWHRAYLWWLEQALQDRASDLPQELADADIALPWWDWTRVRDIPPAYAEERFGDADNPLYASRAYVPTANPPIDHVTTRAPGTNPQARLARPEEIFDESEGLLADTDWASFSDRIEDFHDHVHGWVGGDMTDPATAAFDPVFFAHHCMIDRLWYLWQVRHGNGGIPGELLDLELIPFGKRVRDVLDVQALGYEYALTSTAVKIDGGPNA